MLQQVGKREILREEGGESEERIPPVAIDKLETERENKKEPIAS